MKYFIQNLLKLSHIQTTDTFKTLAIQNSRNSRYRESFKCSLHRTLSNLDMYKAQLQVPKVKYGYQIKVKVPVQKLMQLAPTLTFSFYYEPWPDMLGTQTYSQSVAYSDPWNILKSDGIQIPVRHIRKTLKISSRL